MILSQIGRMVLGLKDLVLYPQDQTDNGVLSSLSITQARALRLTLCSKR